MPASRRLAVLLAAALLACVPAAAHAQGGAGDDQYQDPFGGQTAKPAKPKTPSRPSSGSAGQDDSSSGASGQSSAPAATPSQTTEPSSSAAAPASSSPTPSAAAQELPRTGLDAHLVALLGLGLLAAGVGLRLRLGAVDGPRR
jgi:hypothetical protein